MDLEGVLFALRLAAVALLYLFILGVVAAMLAGIRTSSPPRDARARPDGLVVLEPGASAIPSGSLLPISDGSIIGRLPQSAVYLLDDSVSGRHATLRSSGGVWTVEDLGSTNGTFVDGKPVNVETKIPPGSVLTIGRIRLRMESGNL